MSSGATKQCCGHRLRGQVYDTRSQICCGGTVHNKPKDCCRGRAYDPRECFCCSGAVGVSRSQICCRGIIKRKWSVSPECCGIGSPASIFSRCCGFYAYDHRRYMCRGGRIRSRPPGSSPEMWWLRRIDLKAIASQCYQLITRWTVFSKITENIKKIDW